LRISLPSRPTPTFAYVALRDHLASEIRKGVYRPGQQLPTEHELMERTKLSRHTVRSALDELRLQGMITRVPGKGTFVSTASPGAPTARVIGSAASLFGFDLTGRLQIVEPPRRVGADVQPDDEAAADELEHDPSELGRVAYVRFVGNSPLGLWTIWLPPPVYDQIEDSLLRIEEEPKSSVTRLVADEAHHDAHRAAQLMTAEAASPTVAQALGIDERDPLLVVRRTYYDAQDAPFQHLHVRYVPHHYAYRLDLISGSRALSGRDSGYTVEPVSRGR
jgi:GntR family transcriptional regulator